MATPQQQPPAPGQQPGPNYPMASLYVGDLASEVRLIMIDCPVLSTVKRAEALYLTGCSLSDSTSPSPGDRGDAVREVLHGRPRPLDQSLQGHDHSPVSRLRLRQLPAARRRYETFRLC